MLRPTKHMDPQRSVLALSAALLTRLKALRTASYELLLCFARDTVDGGESLFAPSLSLLFLLGLVAYRPKTDAFEYVGP